MTDIFELIGTKGKILTLCQKHFLEITDQFLFVRSYLTYLFFVCSKIFLPNFLPIIHTYDIVFKFFHHFTIHNMLFWIIDCKIYIFISLHVVFFHVINVFFYYYLISLYVTYLFFVLLELKLCALSFYTQLFLQVSMISVVSYINYQYFRWKKVFYMNNKNTLLDFLSSCYTKTQTRIRLTIARLTFINSFVQRFNFVDHVGVWISRFGRLQIKNKH